MASPHHHPRPFRPLPLLLLLFLATPTQSQSLRPNTCPSLRAFFVSNALRLIGENGLSGIGFHRQFSQASTGFVVQPSPAAVDFPVEGLDYSGTNNPIPGVASPDIVKTDGKRVYIVRGDTLLVVKAEDGGATGKVTGKLKINFSIRDMFLSGDRVLLVAEDLGSLRTTPLPRANVERSPTPEETGPSESTEPGFSMESEVSQEPGTLEELDSSTEPRILDVSEIGTGLNGPGEWDMPAGPTVSVEEAKLQASEEPEAGLSQRQLAGFNGLPEQPSPILELQLIDVSIQIPRVLERLRLEGGRLLEREVNGSVHVVLRSSPEETLPFLRSDFDPDLRIKSGSRQQDINETMAEDWLPKYWYENLECDREGEAACVKQGPISSCERVYTPEGAFPGFIVTSVLTIPLTGNIKPRNAVSIVTFEAEAYISPNSVIVTSQAYRDLSRFPISTDLSTTVHKFERSDDGANYQASSEVVGFVGMFGLKGEIYELGQTVFLQSTTEFFDFDAPTTQLTALTTSNGKLVKTSESTDFRRLANFTDVRFVGSTAYLQRSSGGSIQLVDLSTPGQLKVAGEVPTGNFFYDYLHETAPGRILGIGQFVDQSRQRSGLKATLFDFGDVTMPRELSTFFLPDDSFAILQSFDQRAFLYWAPESIAVVPFLSSRSQDGLKVQDGAIVLDVSENGITERGKVTHAECCNDSAIERALVLNREHLWTASSTVTPDSLLFQVHDILTLATESKTQS